MSLSIDIEVARGGFELRAQGTLQSGITALIGAAGSGKSTLLHTIAGLVRPQRGSIRLSATTLFDAERAIDVPCVKRGIGLVFDDFRLFPHHSVETILRVGRGRLRTPALDLMQVVEALGLELSLGRRPHELSAGERQRVALGRALLAEPEWLLVDEPLASIDAGRQRQILPYLRWVHEALGIPVLYVSHALDEILELTDEIVVLERGRLVGHGEVFDVIGRAPHATATLQAGSSLRVSIEQPDEEGGHIRARLGGQLVLLPFTRVSPNSPGRVRVDASSVLLARTRLAGVSARNQLHGRVVRISALNGRVLVHVEVGADSVLRAELTRDAMYELGIEVGTAVWCVIKTSAFVWL